MFRNGSLRAIALCGLVAGTLDISDAFLFYGVRSHVAPGLILKSIASGLLGKAAFAGGLGTEALGLGIHFFIATCWAALFCLLAARMGWMVRHAVWAGLWYGLVVYAVMNFVVLPLTRATPQHQHGVVLVNAILALMVCIGMTVAVVNRWVLRRRGRHFDKIKPHA